jgi:hypothetical protein
VTFLHSKLDRSQRILDLVRKTSRHVLPGSKALKVFDSRSRLLHIGEHPIEYPREIRHFVGSGHRDPDIEVASRHLIDSVCDPADSCRDPTSQHKSEHDGNGCGDAEKHRKGLQIARIDSDALLGELRVGLMNSTRALELTLVSAIEREGGNE